VLHAKKKKKIMIILLANKEKANAEKPKELTLPHHHPN